MQFEIKCETFVRLAHVALSKVIDESFKCVRIEHQEGKTFAIATNRKIAAIELIGNNPFMLKGAIHVDLNDALLQQCKTESAYSGTLALDCNEQLQFVTAKTLMGYQFQGNVYKAKSPLLENWRSWFLKEPVKVSRGGMFWHGDTIAALAMSAPSNEIVFPEFIDVANPVVVRDFNDEKWFGLFMGNYFDDKTKQVKEATPAILPEWVK